MAKADAEEDDDRHQHTTASADDGQHGFLAAAEFTTENLTFDFQTYAQEEEEHQEIVDEVHQRQGMTAVAEDIEAAYAQRHRKLPQRGIQVLSGRKVGHHESQNGGSNQQGTGADIAPKDS